MSLPNQVCICFNCKYFKPLIKPKDAEELGEDAQDAEKLGEDAIELGGYCHRYAPHAQICSEETGSDTVWPWVDSFNWCGEFNLKDEQEQ